MDRQEKALISGKFIETILQIPVTTCAADLGAIEPALRQYIPDFLKNSVPFFMTQSMVQSFEPDVLYHITDFIHFNFTMFLYKDETDERPDKLLIAGPYLTHQPDTAFCEQVLQENGLTMSLLMPYCQYCLTLPIVSTSTVLDASRTALNVVTGCLADIPYRHYQPQIHYGQELSNLSPEGADEAAMELLEHRYRYEKLMLQEVAEGNQNMALTYYRQFFLDSRSIVRTEDPIRTAKNLGFSLNTMLRKSAETAGIHPVYLDVISSNFAMLIENSNRLEELDEFKYQMISAYCRFVQKHRLSQYSPLVRKAVTYIRIHLADSLSLSQIADGIKVSPSYLSRIFNQEMQESISNYVMQARIDKAAELLAFSPMPVQNIAAYVGFSDLNYFSRCFKKIKKMTPTAYRTSSTIGA